MTLIRRILVIVAFAFWQGGFAFYTAVVVPIGTDVLGSSAAQGFITRRVTVWMNVAGAVAIPILLWDALATRPTRRTRTCCTLLLGAGLLALALIHPRLDAMLDPVNETVSHRSDFLSLHRRYLWISTAQWAVGVVYLVCTPMAWRRIDQGH